MRTINGIIYHSAWDEELSCIQCIHVTDDPEKYCDRCGAECSWRYYMREKSVEE